MAGNQRYNVHRVVARRSFSFFHVRFRLPIPRWTSVPWNDKTATGISRLRRPGSRVRCYVNDLLFSRHNVSPVATRTYLDNYSLFVLCSIHFHRHAGLILFQLARKLESMRPNWSEKFRRPYGISCNLFNALDTEQLYFRCLWNNWNVNYRRRYRLSLQFTLLGCL